MGSQVGVMGGHVGVMGGHFGELGGHVGKHGWLVREMVCYYVAERGLVRLVAEGVGETGC